MLPERSATVVNHSRNPAWHRPALNQSDLPNSFFDMALRRSSQDLTPPGDSVRRHEHVQCPFRAQRLDSAVGRGYGTAGWMNAALLARSPLHTFRPPKGRCLSFRTPDQMAGPNGWNRSFRQPQPGGCQSGSDMAESNTQGCEVLSDFCSSSRVRRFSLASNVCDEPEI